MPIPTAYTAEGSLRDSGAVFSVNRIRRPAGFAMETPHYHPYYELFYLISGQCRVFIQHSLYYAQPGDVIFLPPNQLHKTSYVGSHDAERFTITFLPEYIAAFDAMCPEMPVAELFVRHKITLLPERRTRAEELLIHIWQNSTLPPDDYTAADTSAALSMLLVLLGRSPASSQQQAALTDEGIQAAAQFIYDHHREQVTLEQAADVAHISATYFSKKFRSVTGFGFKEYLTGVRLQDGAALLRTTNLSVTEIALACGFTDGNYFGEAFKKANGITPRQLRSGYQNTAQGDEN